MSAHFEHRMEMLKKTETIENESSDIITVVRAIAASGVSSASVKTERFEIYVRT